MTEITQVTNKKGSEFDIVRDLKVERGADISSERKTVFVDPTLYAVQGRFPEAVIFGGLLKCNHTLYGIETEGNLWIREGLEDSRAVAESELYVGPVRNSQGEAGKRIEASSVYNKEHSDRFHKGSTLEVTAIYDESERERIEALRRETMKELTVLGQGLTMTLRSMGYDLDKEVLLKALRPENHEGLLAMIKKSQVGRIKAGDMAVRLDEYGQSYNNLRAYTDYIGNDRFGSGIHISGPIGKGTTLIVGGKEYRIQEDKPQREGRVFSLRINRGVLQESYVPETDPGFNIPLEEKVRTSYRHKSAA